MSYITVMGQPLANSFSALQCSVPLLSVAMRSRDHHINAQSYPTLLRRHAALDKCLLNGYPLASEHVRVAKLNKLVRS